MGCKLDTKHRHSALRHVRKHTKTPLLLLSRKNGGEWVAKNKIPLHSIMRIASDGDFAAKEVTYPFTVLTCLFHQNFYIDYE